MFHWGLFIFVKTGTSTAKSWLGPSPTGLVWLSLQDIGADSRTGLYLDDRKPIFPYGPIPLPSKNNPRLKVRLVGLTRPVSKPSPKTSATRSEFLFQTKHF